MGSGVAGSLRSRTAFEEIHWTALLKCTEPDPAKRYQKAGEVFEDWKAAAAAEFGAPRWHPFNLPQTN